MVWAPTGDTAMVWAGGALLLVEATQKVKAVGLSVTLWAKAVSRQHRAMSSTDRIQVMDLKQVFTNFLRES